MYNSYISSGVIITPNVVAEGDKATVTYKGLLKNSGADSVYMRVGYSCEWKDTADIQMRRTNEGFEATLPVTRYEKLYMAFKDSANNWDNNSGNNYSFEVQPR